MILLVFAFAVIGAIGFTAVMLATRPEAWQTETQRRLRTIHASVELHKVGIHDKGSDDAKQRLLRELGIYLERFKFSDRLQTLIVHAGSKSTVGSVGAVSLGLAMICGLVVFAFSQSVLPTVFAVCAGGASRYISLRFQRAKRVKTFNIALADAIELMTRALHAGHAMSSAIEIVADQSPAPLGIEFAAVAQQQKLGIPFRDALLQMTERIPSQDLQFFTTAVLVQKETGGDLTEILDRAAHVIRERIRIEGEVKTYTAQGRLTGWILSLLPVVMLGLINIISPGYSDILFHDPTGQKLLYAGGTLIVIGAAIIRKIVNIKV